jgi:hypothetical protein
MQIARWRLGLVAVSLVALGALGGGFVQASRTQTPTNPGTAADLPAAPPAKAVAPAQAEPLELSAAAFTGPKIEALAELAARPAVARRIWRHLDRLVHAEATVDLPNKGLTTYTADGGTLASVVAGTVSVREKNGETVAIAANGDTKVRKGGKRVGVGALAAGDRVVVISQKRGASVVALHVLVRPMDG